MPEEYLDVSPDDPVWGHATAKTTDGVRLHYVRRGRGTPVLLLHGWPGFWYDWRRLIPPARPRRRPDRARPARLRCVG
jgi:pimeloyl-ACP methyl ester carboxylesterase